MLKHRFKLSRWISRLFLLGSVVAIFLYLRRPVTTNDTYFGLKIGEYIIEHRSIPDHEIFSWSAEGRPIVMYEWLAQVLIFLLFRIGGFGLIELYVAAIGVVIFLLFYFIFRRVFNQPWWVSLAVSWFSIASMTEFLTPRPYLVAFVGFLLLFSVLFQYIFFGRNLLWVLLPVTYLWTNSHASFIFMPGFLALYAFLVPQKRKLLFLFSALTSLVSLSPPLWYHPHLWLFHFAQYLPVLTRYVMEWKPLGAFTFNYGWYGALTIFTLVLSLWYSRITKQWSRWIIAAPLVLLSLASFQAIRHVVFGTLSLILVTGLFLPHPSQRYRRVTIPFLLAVIAASLWLFVDKRLGVSRKEIQFQEKTLLSDIEFLRHARLQGHMFNEFALGSYLLYYLYPQYQVMVDARADVYICCELADMLPIVEAKHASRTEFAKVVEAFFRKYDVSYAIVPYPSQNPLEQTSTTLMADLLLDNPDWHLIYASDDWQILLKNDGVNQYTWDNDSMTSATPYRLSEFRPHHELEAQREYERLIAQQDSGVAQDGLGETLLAQGKFDEAISHFERAVQLNPYVGKPHLGLARIALQKHDAHEAIPLLQKAISLSPYLGDAYLLLAQTLEQTGQKEAAISSANTGLNANVDLISRQKLAQLLHNLQN